MIVGPTSTKVNKEPGPTSTKVNKESNNHTNKPKSPMLVLTACPCKYSSAFKFSTFSNWRETTRRCEWIISRSGHEDFLKAKCCLQSENSILIRGKYLLTCGNYLMHVPISKPTFTLTPYVCTELSSFTFSTFKGERKFNRRCKCLKAKPSNEAYRKVKFYF